MADFESECFFVSPIGPQDSPERDRADGVLRAIVEPAAARLELKSVRADAITEPGQITSQIVEHVLSARAVVADLTGGNPNVYYEIAIRHAVRKPCALIAEQGTRLPFDAHHMRTIFFNSSNLKSVVGARDQLFDHLRLALKGAVDSPVSSSVDIMALREGSSTEQQLAEIKSEMEYVQRQLGRSGDALDSLTNYVRQVLGGLSDEGNNGDSPQLTIRELQVLMLLARGKNSAEIGDDLFISENTVRSHLSRIVKKLGARSRVEAVVIAIFKGLLTFKDVPSS